MILNVTFKETDKQIITEFSELYRVTDGGFASGYEQGYQQGIQDATPTETITLTYNGEYDITKFATAIVDVPIPEGYLKPDGRLTINKNGLYDISTYEYVDISVPIPDGYVFPIGDKKITNVGTYDVKYYETATFSVPTEEKIFTPTKETQEYTPEEVYITNVIVNPIPEEYIIPAGKIEISALDEVDVTQYSIAQIKDENLKAENIAENIEVLGIVGTFKGGVNITDADATPEDLLLGKVAYNNDGRIEGTIETYDYSNSEGAIIDSDITALLSNTILESYTNNNIEVIAAYKFRDGQLKRFNSTSCITLGGQSFYNSIIEECNTPNIQSIGSSAFQNCQYLKKVYFSKNTSAIASTAFAGCVSMTYAHIGNASMINNYAFQNCSALKTIIITSTSVPSLSTKDVFTGTPIVDGTGYIYVLDELVESYKSSTNWSPYASQIKPLSELEVE